MLSLLLTCAFSTGLWAQTLFYDASTQPPVPWPGGGQIIDEACSNLGQFAIAGGDGSPSYLNLIGNSGEVIASAQLASGEDLDGDGDDDDLYVVDACNHNSTVAIVQINDLWWSDRVIQVTLIGNSPANGGIHMAGTIMTTTLPSYQVQFDFGSWTSGIRLRDIQAAMDDEFLYLTFEYYNPSFGSNPDQYWYGIIKLGDSPSWQVTPRPVPRPGDGVPATGNAEPTVACNRWTYGTGNATIAFAYIDPITSRQIPASYVPPIDGSMPPSNKLPEPSGLTPLSPCLWVRAVDYDNPDGISLVHYFYAYAPNGVAVNQYPNPTLWFTDGANVMSTPISSDLVVFYAYYSGSSSALAAPAVGDAYLAATTNASVYCAYVENPGQNLKICRQWGNNIASVAGPGCSQFYTLGCNQMGIFIPYDAGGQFMWRAFRPFMSDVLENTVASGLCKVIPNRDPSILGIGVGTPPEEAPGNLNDTLRVLAESNITPAQIFQFSQTSPPGPPVALWAGEHPSANIDADPGTTRADIILDKGADVDFGGAEMPPLQNVTLQARSDGSIEYNGAVFNNENGDLIGCMGETRVKDSSEKRRGIWYMNDALSSYNDDCGNKGIYGGTIFGGVKGEVRLLGREGIMGTSLTINGNGSGMDFDSTFMYFNNTYPQWNEYQIYVWDNGDGSGPASNAIFTNGLLVNLWQHSGLADNGDWTQQPDNPGTSSGILTNGTQDINISGNNILYVPISILNPANIVSFENNSCEVIDNQLYMGWGTENNGTFSGTANILGNTIHASWPNGSESLNATTYDFEFIGFNVTDQHKLKVDNNIFDGRDMSGTTNAWDPNSVAVWLAYGTNADVTGNTITDYGIGIGNEIRLKSNSFICSNIINETHGPRGTGIWEDLDAGSGFPKLNQCSNLAVGYSANGLNASTLIENNFYDNDTGASFNDYVTTVANGSHSGTDNYAGFNHFENNSITQVQIGGDNSATPEFGPENCDGEGNPGVEQPTWGQNTFVEATGSLLFTGGQTLGWPVDDNHWTPGIATEIFACLETIGDPNMHIDYIDNVDGTQNDIEFACGSGFTNHRKGGSLPQSVEEDTSAPDYLYNEALKWDNINPQFALDTMRLFVEREPHLMPLTEKGIQYTGNFVAEMDTLDSAGKSWINSALWIEEYNWLASIYTLDTTKYYRVFVISTMASCEIYFDRNGAANLWYNYMLLFPDPMDVGLAGREIASIRGYQAIIPEDTTPFYKIPIPPLPYGANYVEPNIAGSVHIAAWPNPVKDMLVVDITSTFSAPASLILYDALGKAVRTLPATRLRNGDNPMEFSLSDLPSGSYYLRLAASVHVQTLKIVKQ